VLAQGAVLEEMLPVRALYRHHQQWAGLMALASETVTRLQLVEPRSERGTWEKDAFSYTGHHNYPRNSTPWASGSAASFAHSSAFSFADPLCVQGTAGAYAPPPARSGGVPDYCPYG